MTHRGRRPTDAEDASRILRGWKERIEALEETERGDTKNVQLFRAASDTCTCSDSVAVDVGTAGGFVFDDSKFDTDEFAD